MGRLSRFGFPWLMVLALACEVGPGLPGEQVEYGKPQAAVPNLGGEAANAAVSPLGLPEDDGLEVPVYGNPEDFGEFVPAEAPEPLEMSLSGLPVHLPVLPAFVPRPPREVLPMPLPSIRENPPAMPGVDMRFDGHRPIFDTTERFDLDETDEVRDLDDIVPMSNSCSFVGGDSRTTVSGSSFPYSAVVKLEMKFGNSWYGCSGVIIRSNLVLTAGHCVYSHDHGAWADQIIVTPRKTCSSEPYGKTYGEHFHSVKGWTENKNYNFDIGLIRLASALGSNTGTLGFGAYSDSDLMSFSQNTAGYPYDKGGCTMVHDYNATKKVTDGLICSAVDICSGQSGSPLWAYFSESGNRIVTGAVSHSGGTCSPNSGIVRITSALLNWIKEVAGMPLCSSGACCSNGKFLSSTSVCNSNYDTEYRCSGTGCGATAQKRVQKRYCSGTSASCDGSTAWDSWTTVQSCTASQLCATDRTSFAKCSTCQNGCQGGACCDCQAGECCDGCRFKSDDHECQSDLDVEYRCAGDACGGSPEIRALSRFCSGMSAGCGGDERWGDWNPLDQCFGSEMCITDGTTGATCSDCPHGCDDLTGTCCECSDGPCCDGCRFVSERVMCHTGLDQEYRCTGDTACGSSLETRVLEQFCGGANAACDGPTDWSAWNTVETCGADAVCQADNGMAGCVACPFGCQDGECCECDSGSCCDGCRFRGTDFRCETNSQRQGRCVSGEGEEGPGCGRTHYTLPFHQSCSGDESDCSGAIAAGDPEDTFECGENQYCDPDLGCLDDVEECQPPKSMGGCTAGSGAGAGVPVILVLSSLGWAVLRRRQIFA